MIQIKKIDMDLTSKKMNVHSTISWPRRPPDLKPFDFLIRVQKSGVLSTFWRWTIRNITHGGIKQYYSL